MPAASYEITIAGSIADIPSAALLRSRGCGAFLAAHRLLELERDSRWESKYLVSSQGGETTSVLAVYEPLVPNVDALYASALGRIRADPLALLLAGGRADFSASLLRYDGAPPASARELAALCDGLRDVARASGRQPVIPFTNAESRGELSTILGAGVASIEVAEDSILDAPPDFPAYLASLKSSHRSVVRRDHRALAKAGLTLGTCCWSDAPAEALDMVADVRAKHGRPEDPRLLKMRLEAWAENPAITDVAFTCRSNDALVAICFGWQWEDQLQLYEVGLVNFDRHRHLGYVSVLVYQPLIYAASAGLRSVWLGLGAVEPKRMRGARVRPVYALTAPP
jgi:uncharacterized protein